MNTKVKQIVGRFSSLESFVERFFGFIIKGMKRHRRQHLRCGKELFITTTDEAGKQFSRLLTPYAYDCIKKVEGFSLGSQPRFCTCSFQRAMMLPCSHIVVMHENLQLAKFYQKHL